MNNNFDVIIVGTGAAGLFAGEIIDDVVNRTFLMVDRRGRCFV